MKISNEVSESEIEDEKLKHLYDKVIKIADDIMSIIQTEVIYADIPGTAIKTMIPTILTLITAQSCLTINKIFKPNYKYNQHFSLEIADKIHRKIKYMISKAIDGEKQNALN